jgi:hypothetical protein
VVVKRIQKISRPMLKIITGGKNDGPGNV